jgi:hypothetical protein
MRAPVYWKAVSDTARILLTTALLSGSAFAMFVWQLTRLDVGGPDRLVAQLRLAQWGALLLAAIAGISLGLTIAHDEGPFGSLEVALSAAFLIVAAVAMLREPRSALYVLAIAFVLHALFEIAHRPGALPSVAPRWYAVGSSIYDVYIAAFCYWAARR